MSRLDTATRIRHQVADGTGEFVAERNGCQVILPVAPQESRAITIERVFVAPEARGGAWREHASMLQWRWRCATRRASSHAADMPACSCDGTRSLSRQCVHLSNSRSVRRGASPHARDMAMMRR